MFSAWSLRACMASLEAVSLLREKNGTIVAHTKPLDSRFFFAGTMKQGNLFPVFRVLKWGLGATVFPQVKGYLLQKAGKWGGPRALMSADPN